MSEQAPTPIVYASDGPRLVLANGSVVQLLVEDASGSELIMWEYDQGAAVCGPEVDEETCSIAIVDDADADEIEAVREVIEHYE